MTDFSSMTGYEFEDFISAVLKSQGFHVTQTAYSNDGGIDLVAELDDPLIKGKYIIQCKKWRGNVGQPEIRDLYGVVSDARANKGILITTSDFTKQAYAFAYGKNLELINGETLASIVSNSILSDSKAPISGTGNIFNRERYDYLVNQYSETLKTARGYDVYHELMTFLWNYFWRDETTACKKFHIFDKVIDISRKTLNKIASNKHLGYRKADCRLNIYNAYIVTGRLYDATNMLLDEKNFYLDKWYPRKRQDFDAWEKGEFSLVDSGIRYCPKLRTQHLFRAYKLVGYDKGCRAMQNCVEKFICSDRDNSLVGFSDEKKQLFYESAVEEREKVLAGFYDDVFYWSSVYYGDHKNSSISCSGSCGTDYSTSKSFSFIKANYFIKEDLEICDEIDKAFREHGMVIE